MSSSANGQGYHYPDAEREDILRMIPPDGVEIGSIGCGYAATEHVLVRQGRRVHGADTSAEAIGVAATRLTSARVVLPGDPPPFATATLDGLILADVLEHIPSAWVALAQFTSMVKPGGWVVISVPNMRSFKVFAKLILRGDWPEDPEGIFDETHVQVMTRRRIERWCQTSGLLPEAWFDQYALGGMKQRILKGLDVLTLRCFHEFSQHRLMVRARRVAASV